MKSIFAFVGLTAIFTVKPIRDRIIAGVATLVGFGFHFALARAADYQTTKE